MRDTMSAALTQHRDGCLIDAFMVRGVKFTENPDGSETCRMIFPRTISVQAGDAVKLSYYTSEKS